jgi:hypothetical protein
MLSEHAPSRLARWSSTYRSVQNDARSWSLLILHLILICLQHLLNNYRVRVAKLQSSLQSQSFVVSGFFLLACAKDRFPPKMP